MSPRFQTYIAWGCLVIAAIFPFFGVVSLVDPITTLLPFLVLALALNVVVGYTGMLHLGIMAFFSIGVFSAAIATSNQFPFAVGNYLGLLIAFVITALFGMMLGAPTLRLRGDYLALVTLGFGEMVKDTLVNLPALTNGIKGIGSLPEFPLPEWWRQFVQDYANGAQMYFVNLAALVVVWWLLANIERSRLGRAWIALREDELAAQCMGLNTTRLKLAAFALCAGLAGLAGALYLNCNPNSQSPQNYDFNLSILVLAGVILGGIGNRAGAVLGVSLVLGFDRILIPWLSDQVKVFDIAALDPASWKLMIYGLALVMMMRFRPVGILPERRQLDHTTTKVQPT